VSAIPKIPKSAWKFPDPTYEQMKAMVEKDPAQSYFVKDMLYEADRRDPVNVIVDCKVLIRLMEQRIRDNTQVGLAQV